MTTLDGLLSLEDYAARAREVLAPGVWDFLVSGWTRDGRAQRRNRAGFDALTIRPRILRDVRERDLSTTVLGSAVDVPVMLAPAGVQRCAHPEGEVASVRGAGRAGALMALSTASNRSIEEVAAAAGGPLWFQLTHWSDAISAALVARAEAAGYRAICLTVDAPVRVAREVDRRGGYVPPAGPTELGSFEGELRPRLEAVRAGTEGSAMTWERIAWVRELTELPLVLKGVTTAEDTRLAVEHGAAGVVVSNHSGYLLDAVASPIEALPEVVDAASGRLEVYLDSGVRRGADVFKALALGARAVAIGQPVYWGLAVGGAEGVAGVLEVLRGELDAVMAWSGQSSVGDLSPELVGVPADWAGHAATLAALTPAG